MTQGMNDSSIMSVSFLPVSCSSSCSCSCACPFSCSKARVSYRPLNKLPYMQQAYRAFNKPTAHSHSDPVFLEDWRRSGGGLEEDWMRKRRRRRTAGGLEEDWSSIGGGLVEEGMKTMISYNPNQNFKNKQTSTKHFF